MDPFVQQLAALCRTHVTRSKWVIVPTHAIGRTLGERLVLDGTNWLNLRFVTPLDIALRMGAPFLVERGIDPSEEGLGPALMMRLLLDLPLEGGYFRALADQPTMAQALWSTVRELRMAGVKADHLQAAAFESAAKHRELRALLAAYERFLADRCRGDMAAVYEEALAHADWCPIQRADCWTELPETIWTPLQRRLLDVMPGERLVPRALRIAGVAVPRRLDDRTAALLPRPDSLRLHTDRDPVSPTAATPLAFLMDPGAHPGAAAGLSSLALFHAGGVDAEVEEVFRRILTCGAPLDQVEIACASDAHVALVWEKALRHEWAVTLGPGIPAAATRPGRALIGFCDWIETDFSAGHLRRLLQSGDMGIEHDEEGFTAGQAARTLARAEAGWGRATYGLSLDVLRKGYDARAGDPDLSEDDRRAAREKAALTGTIAAWIARLIATIPAPAPDGRVRLQDVVGAALAFLSRSTSRASQLDHRAAAALGTHVVELRALDGFVCSLPEALRFIRERVESLAVAAERPRPGHLYACHIQQAGYSGRPQLFVVGLEEGRVFPSAAEDAVLLDAERAAILPALRRSGDKIDEAVYAVLSRLATCGNAPESEPARSVAEGRIPDPASGLRAASARPARACGGADSLAEAAEIPRRITFSYSVRDTREFRETYASWLMLQAFRLQRADAAASYRAMKASLGEPVSCVPATPDTAATESGWWLRTVAGTGGAGVEAIESSFAVLARGRHADAERGSGRFTAFDGRVPQAGHVLDPCDAANAFSVTDLEAAATCPFRFFLKRGLGLRPIDERERDKDIWLDPLTRGSELHDIYAALLRRCRDGRRPPDVKQDGAWLTGVAEAALERLNQEMPPATSEILARETADFLADVELFLEGECEPSSSEPVGLEVSFGRPLADEVEALARVEPVSIDLGGGLTFRIAGRIDRIDQVGPSEFEVLDYKTGGYWRDDWKGTFNGGRRLQHALYGLAAVELLRGRCQSPKVTRAVYYFSSHKGRRERVPIAAPTRQQTAAVLADLREVIVQGAFVHAPDERACKFCDFTAACGAGVHEQAQGKLEDPALKAYARLGLHD